MDDNQNKNQPNTNTSDYQKILDEYAASVKPDTSQSPETSPEEKIPIDSLKEAISLPPEPKKITAETQEKTLADDLEEAMIQKKQPESPIHPSLIANLETDDESEKPVAKPISTSTESNNLPPFPQKEESTHLNPLSPSLETTADIKPEKSPEEIKAEINRLLSEDEVKPGETNSVPSTNPSSISKVFFVFALILFFAVAAGLAYFLFLSPSDSTKTNTSDSTQKNSVTPTDIPADSNGTCELNSKTYQVGESFQSADGCNTCSCSSAGVITCTEMACSTTPVVNSATKSATVTSSTKTTITPTKVATPSIKLSPATTD